MFLYGGLGSLYAMCVLIYPANVSATGTGWCVSVGRLGAIVAPFTAGFAMDQGASGYMILLAMIPPLLICGAILALALSYWQASAQQELRSSSDTAILARACAE